MSPLRAHRFISARGRGKSKARSRNRRQMARTVLRFAVPVTSERRAVGGGRFRSCCSRGTETTDVRDGVVSAAVVAPTVVSLVVNDEPRTLALRSADRSLLSVLRDDLGLTGTKEGCGIGVCGACTVIVDSEMVSSCIQLAALVDGATVRTIE